MILTPRWRLTRALRTPAQERFWRSTARFNICHAGRRSGKTELAKMRGVRRAATFFQTTGLTDGLVIFGAPTYTQARNIYWNDLLELVPPSIMDGDPKLGDMSIRLLGGTEIRVVGFDVAARAEGRPIDHLVLDEYANMKAEVWGANLRPALSTPGRPPGTADLIGVPEGWNHYRDLVETQKGQPDWEIHHWYSEDVVDPLEIEAAKRDLDPLTYEQEYRGSFISFQGRVYYQFDAGLNLQPGLAQRYNRDEDLIVCFDFNRKPGVALVLQEMEKPAGGRADLNSPFTAVIGEVYIPADSNTMIVCQRFLERWGTHRGRVLLYGDASGGNKTAAAVEGSDWDIINRMVYPVFGPRCANCYPRRNGPERSRVNAVNSRLRSFSGVVSLLIDPDAAPKLIKDLEGVRTVKDGSGAVDKTSDPLLTHLSDALGYYVVEKFPAGGPVAYETSTAYG